MSGKVEEGGDRKLSVPLKSFDLTGVCVPGGLERHDGVVALPRAHDGEVLQRARQPVVLAVPVPTRALSHTPSPKEHQTKPTHHFTQRLND